MTSSQDPFANASSQQDPFALPSFQAEVNVIFDDPSINPNKNGLALAGLILGIVAVVASITIFGLVIAWLVAIVGIVVSIIALTKAKNYAPMNQRKGMAIAGLILSALTLIASVIIGVVFLSVFSVIEPCMNLPQDQMQTCINERLANQ